MSTFLILKIIYRVAFADELGRAASLCAAAPALPGDEPPHCFVATRERPVERLVAAAIWRMLTESDGSHCVDFEWSAIGSLAEAELLDFLRALMAEVQKKYPACERIGSSAWLPEGHPLAAILEAAGFAAVAHRQGYGAVALLWREALEAVVLSANEVISAPTGGHFDGIKALLCGPALRPEELAHGFQTAGGESPSLFDPRCSAIMTEAGKVVAVCLANSSHGHLTVVALSGTETQCDLLLLRCLQARDHLAAAESLSFQIDDRKPSVALFDLSERLPVQNGGCLQRWEAVITADLI